MRDYKYLDQYYSELIEDLYPQPPDDLHVAWAKEVVVKACTFTKCKTVLDVGCGEAFVEPMFAFWDVQYLGICLGNDYKKAIELGRHVEEQDFNFLPYGNGSFDMVFSRHSLEHSPFPILSLMEWNRVSKRWLCLIVPNPDHFGYIGRNHYAVSYPQQIRWWLRRAGWRMVWRQSTKTELRYICKKQKRISYEGWAETPVTNEVYEDDRDDR